MLIRINKLAIKEGLLYLVLYSVTVQNLLITSKL